MSAAVRDKPVLDETAMHWLDELKDAHKGELAFVLGNGWSMNFYDPKKMKKDGILFGANLSFTRYPLDYLTWQDSKVHEKCAGFDGIKLVPRRKGIRGMEAVSDSTYYYGFGRLDNLKTNQIQLMHSGGLALQLAIRLGCNPVVLVGCDCRTFKVGYTEKRYGGHRSNIFRDKMAERALKRNDMIQKGDKWTTSQLSGFADKFTLVYKKYKDSVNIYQLGSWSIMDTIPCIEWEEYWTDEHPRRKQHAG